MAKTLTAQQMRDLERAAMDGGKVTGLDLMERAAEGVVDAIYDEWPAFADGPRRVIVFCGPGNNGGDGFVVARLLQDRGWTVDVFAMSDPENLPPDAAVNAQRWARLGAIQQFNDADYAQRAPQLAQADLIVDAMFGIGLSRPAQTCAGWIHRMDDIVKGRVGQAKIVSIDVPTGLESDTGSPVPIPETAQPHAVSAHLTVTFHAPKKGHETPMGKTFCGKVVVQDIGL